MAATQWLRYSVIRPSGYPARHSLYTMLETTKTNTVHLCPEVIGSLMLDGKTVEDIRIVRGLDFSEEYQEDEARTDTRGHFYFPLAEKEQHNANLFGAASIMQVITAHVEGRESILGTTLAPNIIRHKTISEKLSALHCNLSNAEQGFSFPDQESSDGGKHEVLSICRW